jgi:thiol-disulfide isomerase/thioredoxin
MKTRVWTAGAAFALVATGLVGVAVLKAPAAQADATGAVPKVDNFRLTSADHQSYELYRMKDDAAIVLVTQADGCGPLRQAAPALKSLSADYASKGVDVLLINSSLKETADQAAAEAASAGYGVPILMDGQQLVGEQLGVKNAGEAIVVNPKTWNIAWRGPVADAPDAVAAVVAGREPKTGQAVNTCSIAFPDRAKAAQFANISYAKDIAPIIQTKCAGCHEPGGIGPMPLTSYDKVKGFAPMIREVIRTKRMPPWHVDPAIGHFQDDGGLTAQETRTLVHWIEGGAPRGTGADPLTKVALQAPEWPLGKPDEIIDVPAYTIPANGVVNYQRPFAANPATEGKWLRASTFQIDQRQAVHHILTGYIANPPKSGTEATESLWGSTLGTFAVGTNPMQMPKDLGSDIPAGGAIGFQNHYTPFGKEVVAHSKIGLYFYKEQPKLVMRTNTIVDPTILIPANTERHKEVAYLTFPHEAIVYGAFIHAHYRGSGSELKIITPDGKSKVLISVPKYDFNWQRDYSFDQPVTVPAGSKLVATYIYDNSKRNPANPDPNRVVPWGEQSFDEMLYTTLRYRWTDETSSDQAVGKAHDAEMMGQRYMGIFDDNLDGVIEKAELKSNTGKQLLERFDALDTNHNGVLDLNEVIAAQKMLGARQQTAEAAPASQNR